MATAESVKNDIRRLIDDINLTTGEQHTCLESGVNSLIRKCLDGTGTSAAPPGLYIGRITPEENLDAFPIRHNLGTTKILLAALWAENLGDAAPESNHTFAKFWAATDVPTLRGGNGFAPGYTWNSTGGYTGPASPISAAYETLTISDENTVLMPRATSGSTTWYLAGVTYTAVVVAQG